jgi:hypothetical protein
VRLVRGKSGGVTELWWAASRLRPEARMAAEMERRYGAKVRGKGKPRSGV